MRYRLSIAAVALLLFSCFALAQSPNTAATVTAEPSQPNTLVKQVPPVYPEEARRDHIQGTVRLHLVIGVDGSVKEASVVSGPPALRQAAMVAVVQWRYQPSFENGNPVEVESTADVNFVLDAGSSSGAPIQGNAGAAAPPVTAEEQNSIAAKHPEWPALERSPDMEKAKKNLDSGIAAFDQGKYDQATTQLEKSLKLLPQWKFWRRYALTFLGDSLEKQGDFDKAYDAYIVSCNIATARPGSRLPDAKAAQAAGCLVEARGFCGSEVCVELTRSSDLGLAGILQHFGQGTEAQTLDEEARIHKEAADAMRPYSNYQSGADAAAVVYARENRPDLAEAVRRHAAQVQELNAQSEDDSSDSADSQSTPSTLQMILQGLSGIVAARGNGGGMNTSGGQSNSGTQAPCLSHLGESCYDGTTGSLYFKGCVYVRDPKNSNACRCYDRAKGQFCERMD